jgi:hypothetical protein
MATRRSMRSVHRARRAPAGIVATSIGSSVRAAGPSRTLCHRMTTQCRQNTAATSSQRTVTRAAETRIQCSSMVGVRRNPSSSVARGSCKCGHVHTAAAVVAIERKRPTWGARSPVSMHAIWANTREILSSGTLTAESRDCAKHRALRPRQCSKLLQ